MAEFPALPLWTDAYLADLHPRLTLEEHGCMVLLMQFAWRSPDCRLPDDDTKLARMLGVSRAKWRKLRPVMEEIWTVKANFWSQKRLTKEHDYVLGRRERYSERGRKGGEAKALKDKESSLPQADESSASSLLDDNLGGARDVGTHNPHPHPIEKKGTSNEVPKESLSENLINVAVEGGELILQPPESLDRTGFKAWWKLHPKKVGKKAAEEIYRGIIRKREATPRALLVGLIRHIAFWDAEGTETKFILDPERWLKKARWKDDLTVRKKLSARQIILARGASGHGDPGADSPNGDSETEQLGPPVV